MRMRLVKQGLVSIGVGMLISAPICHMAVESWNNPRQATVETISEDFSGLQGSLDNMKRIAQAEAKRAELIAEELERQRRIEVEHEALATLASYEVVVPEDVKLYCERAQEETNVCAELLEAICWRESRFQADAKNAGCLGIMQISIEWHRGRMAELGVTDIYDAEGNIRVGADYLAELFEKWDGDLYSALKEYNGDTSEGVSKYALEIAEVSEALERVHGK